MRSFLLLSAFFIACSSGTTGDDGGTPDGSSPDSSTKDGAVTDGSPSDGSATDGSPTDGGGKLDAGDTCNLNDDQCGPGLKCCHGGANTLDGGNTGTCITPTDAGTCPLVP